MSPRTSSGTAAFGALITAAAIFGATHGRFTDLYVYQFGGEMVLDRLPLYAVRDPINDLPFTYPPFAALVMVPLASLPGWVAAALWTTASMGALVITIALMSRAVDRPIPLQLAALLAGCALALEPVWQNFVFGQINMLLMTIVVVDLLRGEQRSSGVLLGVAAGIKLTPLVFVALLILVGRRMPAVRALTAFGMTIAIGFAVMPSSSLTYWSDKLVHAGRVGPPELAHNQSIYGALTRMLEAPPSPLLWLAIAGPITGGMTIIAAAWWRRGDEALGIALTAMAMLLASPVAWTHHWVWAVPVALLLWSRRPWVAVVWSAVFVARPVVWPPWSHGREFAWSPVEHIVGNGYLLAALAFAIWSAVSLRIKTRSGATYPCLQVSRLLATKERHPAG